MDQTGQCELTAVRVAVRDFIVSNFLFGTDSGSLTDQVSFLNGGIMDSTGILELIEFLESTYQIKIEDEEMLPENLDSIDNVCTFVIRKSSNGAGK